MTVVGSGSPSFTFNLLKTPPPSNHGYFMFVRNEAKQAKTLDLTKKQVGFIANIFNTSNPTSQNVNSICFVCLKRKNLRLIH